MDTRDIKEIIKKADQLSINNKKEKQIPQNIDNSTNILLTGNKVYLNSDKLILIVLTILVAIITYTKVVPFAYNVEQINVSDSEMLKQNVAKVAACQHRHPNSIWNELKKDYKFNKIIDISDDDYPKIMRRLERMDCYN